MQFIQIQCRATAHLKLTSYKYSLDCSSAEFAVFSAKLISAELFFFLLFSLPFHFSIY